MRKLIISLCFIFTFIIIGIGVLCIDTSATDPQYVVNNNNIQSFINNNKSELFSIKINLEDSTFSQSYYDNISYDFDWYYLDIIYEYYNTDDNSTDWYLLNHISLKVDYIDLNEYQRYIYLFFDSSVFNNLPITNINDLKFIITASDTPIQFNMSWTYLSQVIYNNIRLFNNDSYSQEDWSIFDLIDNNYKSIIITDVGDIYEYGNGIVQGNFTVYYTNLDSSELSYFIENIAVNMPLINYGVSIQTAEAYQNGQNDGYQRGYEYGNHQGYQQGKQVGDSEGYDRGYNYGKQVGYAEGYDEINRNSHWFGDGLLRLVDVPFILFNQFLNFEILGINFYYFLLGLFTLFIVIWLFRKFTIK